MKLINALKTIERKLRPGTLIELWMTNSGQIVHTIGLNGSEPLLAATLEELAAAIETSGLHATFSEDFIKELRRDWE